MAPKCCEGWQITFSLSCYKAKDFNNVFSEEKDQQFEQKMSAILSFPGY